MDKSESDGNSDLSPSGIARKISDRGVEKAGYGLLSTAMLAVLAGAFIGLGGIYFTFATAQITISYPFTQIIGGLAFSTGLILVVVAGSELFTGNNLMVMTLVGRRIALTRLVRNWSVVYVGNFAGSILVSGILYMTYVWQNNNYEFAVRAIAIAAKKTNLGFSDAFFLGILCNILVCLAIWLSTGGRSITGKVLGIIFPISAFVALGFEHSVANMYFMSFALMLMGEPGILNALQQAGLSADVSNINIGGFMNNLLPVTLGNIIGGSLFIGMSYWVAYLRK